MNVKKCSACGMDHDAILYFDLKNPVSIKSEESGNVEVYNMMAICPQTGAAVYFKKEDRVAE